MTVSDIPTAKEISNSVATTTEPVDAKALALACFRDTATVVHACAAAGIHRSTWYDWIQTDPKFAAAVVDASEAVADDLEKEAIRRAKEGSDTLIIFLLKSRRPERYRDTLKIETVSPQVRENLRRTIEIVNEMLPTEQADALLARLDAVWG